MDDHQTDLEFLQIVLELEPLIDRDESIELFLNQRQKNVVS
ncbi:MAG TPA: hypothetical protein VGP62_15145 [Bryobacteraceae bacterium]|jgi:hypothetical protein|nr:hypothetical protein [Bryobacteraceae bacterium]